MIGITSTAKGKGLNKSPKTALSPTFQPPHLPSPCRANTKPPSPIGTSRSSHLSPETNTKTQNQLIYSNLKECRCKPQNSPVWLVQGAAIYINIAAPCTTEIHTENQHLTLLVKPRVQPRFLHHLLILCFSCNPVIPKNKKSPKHFPFSVKIPIFASVPRAERSNAAKPAQLPNRYRLPNFLLFKSYLPTDYKKTIVFIIKTEINKFLQWTRQISCRFIASCSNFGKTVCTSTDIRHYCRSLDNILNIILKQFYRLLIKSPIYRKDIMPHGIIKRNSVFPQFPIARHTAPYSILFNSIHRIKVQCLLNIG